MCISGAFKFHGRESEAVSSAVFNEESHSDELQGSFFETQRSAFERTVCLLKVLCEVLQVCKMGKALGIDSNLPHELSLSLGGCEVRMCLVSQIIFIVALRMKSFCE